MRAPAADVGDLHHDMPWQFVLHVQIPLLHVRPLDVVGNGDGIQRAYRPASRRSAHVGVTGYVADAAVENVWRGGALQGFCVGFVAVGVFKENAVATAHRPLAIAQRIPGKTDSRPGIDVFVLLAAGHAICGTALDDAVKDIATAWHQGLGKRGCGWVIKLRSLGRHKGLRGKAKFLVELFLIAAKDAPTQTEVQGELFGDAPVILKIRLEDFIAVVKIRLRAGLVITGDLSGEEVREWVAGTIGIARRKRKFTLQIYRGLLVFLR